MLASICPIATLLHAEQPEGGTGSHCLFIHGFLSSRAQWRLNLGALKSVCQPVVVELWGHGRSPAPRDPGLYSIDSYLVQFEHLRQRLGIASWFVYGQSFGAGLALHYAATHAQQVQGVIVTNTVAAFSTPAQIARRGPRTMLGALEAGGEVGRQALLSLPMHVRHARRLPQPMKEEMLLDAELLDPASIALSIRHTGPALSIVDRLPEVHVPVMLLNGRFEANFQPMRGLALATMPCLEVVDLDGGHAVNAECADACNEVVAGFITRHAAI